MPHAHSHSKHDQGYCKLFHFQLFVKQEVIWTSEGDL